jgi:hypothetical protein
MFHQDYCMTRLWTRVLVAGLLICLWTGLASADSKNGIRPLRVVTYNLLHDGAGSGFLNGKPISKSGWRWRSAS